MFRPKSNNNTRQAPTDLDQPPLEPILDFDLTRPWPEIYFGQRFGPGLLNKSMKAGYLIIAEIPEIPYPVMIKESRWCDGVLEVLTLEGWRIPDRLFTRRSLKGLTSSGLLMERKQT
jgi:hypothetical protein